MFSSIVQACHSSAWKVNSSTTIKLEGGRGYGYVCKAVGSVTSISQTRERLSEHTCFGIIHHFSFSYVTTVLSDLLDRTREEKVLSCQIPVGFGASGISYEVSSLADHKLFTGAEIAWRGSVVLWAGMLWEQWLWSVEGLLRGTVFFAGVLSS